MKMRVVSFFDLLDQYIREKPLAEATIKTYRGVVNRFVSDTNIISLDKITFEALLDWRLDVVGRSSDITWNNYLRHMRALWKFAMMRDYVPGIDIFKELNWGKYKSSKIKTLSQDQLKEIVDYLDTRECSLDPGWFWEMVIRFIYYTGVRRKQLVNLKWGDLELQNRMLRLDAIGEKTDIHRELPLRRDLILYLEAYRNRVHHEVPGACHNHKQLFNITLHNSRYEGELMNVTQLSGFFKRLSKKTGFAVSSHRLRHTMADEIVRKTGQIKHVQEILGHNNVKTTIDFYLHPNLSQIETMLCELSSI